MNRENLGIGFLFLAFGILGVLTFVGMYLSSVQLLLALFGSVTSLFLFFMFTHKVRGQV